MKLVNLEFKELHRTAEAILLWDGVKRSTYGSKQGIWFPLSVVEINEDGTFTVPEQMAIDKGAV